MMFAALALLIFASLVLAGYALAGVMTARETERETLRRRLSTMVGSVASERRRAILKDRRLSTIAVVNRLLAQLSLVRPLARLVTRAGLKKRVGEVLLYMPLIGGVVFLVVMTVTGKAAAGVMAGLAAALLPVLLVKRMARKRVATFADQLPDGLDLVRAALQAGHGLMPAMSVVADEFPDPVAQEFRDVVEEVRLGRPLREALDNLAERVGNDDMRLLEVGILTAQDVGGNLAEVLDKVSYTIRERFKLQREVQVMTAQGRMSGGVLTAMPFLAGLGLTVFSPGYFTPMLATKSGHMMIAYALVSVLMGHIMIRRLVKLDV
jgi:tight adherence protein B